MVAVLPTVLVPVRPVPALVVVPLPAGIEGGEGSWESDDLDTVVAADRVDACCAGLNRK